MKLLNLIPKENIRKNRNQIIRKVLISLTIVPVLFYGYLQYSLHTTSEEIKELELNVSESARLESSIKASEEKTVRINNIVSGVDRQTLPLNHFMLFLGESTPSTVKIHSIVSEELVNDRIAEGLNSEGYDLAESSSGRINYVKEETEAIEDVVAGTPPVASKDTSKGSAGPAQKPTSSTATANKPTGESVPTEKLEQNSNIEVSVNSPKFLLIRGYTTSINDLGYFTSILKGEKYVDDVEISTIKNYYNGVDNYRIFEIRVRVGVGE